MAVPVEEQAAFVVAVLDIEVVEAFVRQALARIAAPLVVLAAVPQVVVEFVVIPEPALEPAFGPEQIAGKLALAMDTPLGHLQDLVVAAS